MNIVVKKSLIVAIIFSALLVSSGCSDLGTEEASLSTNPTTISETPLSTTPAITLYTPTKFGTGIDFSLPSNHEFSFLNQDINYMANLLLYGIGIQPDTYDPTNYFYAPDFIGHEVDTAPPEADAEWYRDLFKYRLTSVDGHTYNLTVYYSMRLVTCELDCSSLPYLYNMLDASEINVYEADFYHPFGEIKIHTNEFVPTQTTPTQPTISQEQTPPQQSESPLSESKLKSIAEAYFNDVVKHDIWLEEAKNNKSIAVTIATPQITSRSKHTVTVRSKFNYTKKENGTRYTGYFYASAIVDIYTGEVLSCTIQSN